MKAPPRFFLLLLLLLTPWIVLADNVLLTPDAVVASSEQLPASNLTDGSGIIGYAGQTTIELTSVHAEDIAFGWAAGSNDPMPRLTYVWELPQEICGFVMWQAVGANGVKDFLLSAYDPNGNLIGVWTFSATEEVDIAGAAQDIPPRFFPIGSEENPVSNVERVVVEIRGNHGGDLVALGETHFAQPSGQPAEGEICLFDDRTISRWHVPLDEKDQSLWYQKDFGNETNWRGGRPCLGYEISPLCDDLIVYLTMDAARVSGTTVLDTSGSPIVHNGTIVGSSVFSIPGQVLEGLDFPGNTSNYVTIRHHNELDPVDQDYTAAVWVRPQDPTAPIGLIAQKRFSQGGGGWIIGETRGQNTNNSVVQLLLDSGEVRSVLMPPLKVGQWNHIGFVVDRLDQKMIGYLDGMPQGSVDLPETDQYFSNSDIQLMNTLVVNDQSYDADLDEFAIWKRALKSEEMRDVYDAGVAGQSFKTSGGSSGLYTPFIETNVGSQMYGVNSTIWERIHFQLSSTQGLQGMRLKIRYDDGFLCYLNGVEVARRNAPAGTPLPYNAAAAAPRADNLALTEEVINLDSFVGLLQAGDNVLALHGLNENKDASRFLLCPQLCVDKVDCRGRNNGTDFWVTFPENAKGDASNPKEISVCLTGAPGTPGRVEMPRLGVSIPFILNGVGEAKVFLNPGLAELVGPDVVMDNGVHITAQLPIAVVGLNHINYSTDGFLALPTKLLGTEHLILAYPNVWDGLPELNGSEFGVVATADGTIIQVTPSVDTAGHPAGVPYYVKLDEGQTYQLMNTEDGKGDLSGTRIRANQRIAVFAGHRCANVESSDFFFCDHVVEQIPSVIHWRNQYVMGPLATRLNGDTVRVIAALDSTDVFFNGVLQATLNQGEVFEGIVTSATAITTNGRPVLAAQYSNSSDFDGVIDSDPFMALLPPLDAFATAYRICAPPTSGFDKNYLNLAVPIAAIGATTVDGVALPGIPGVVFAAIPTTALAHVQVPVSASHPHNVLGPSPFSVIAYGFAGYDFDSYAFPAGLSYPRTPPTVTAPAGQTTHTSSTTGTASTPNIQGVSTVEDDCDPPGTVSTTQTPRPQATLEPGIYVVTISATNSDGLTGYATTLLEVLPPWPQVYFPDAYPDPELEDTVWGCLADPDNDLVPNEGEWQFGTDPNNPSSFPSTPIVQAADGMGAGLRVQYRRRFNDPLASYLEQGGTDPASLSSGPAITQTVSTSIVYPGGEYEDVVIEAVETTQVPGPARYFLRVEGSGCPE